MSPQWGEKLGCWALPGEPPFPIYLHITRAKLFALMQAAKTPTLYGWWRNR